MDVFTVSFFGHRLLEQPFVIEERLEKRLRKLLQEKEYVEFLVGRDGEFDLMVASAVRRCKRTVRADNSTLTWVMLYETADYQKNEEAYRGYYDEIELCSSSANGHYKAAFQIRNRQMVDRSDLVIFAVEHPLGGAFQTMRYAQRQEKSIVNLSQEQ